MRRQPVCAFALTIALLLALNTSPASANALPPGGSCFAEKTRVSCVAYSSCFWANSACKRLPSSSPTTSSPVTASPTAQPTTGSPTFRPSAAPIFHPSLAPATPRPTRSKCAVPATRSGCTGLSARGCARWAGCAFVGGKCAARCAAPQPPGSAPATTTTCVTPALGCGKLPTAKRCNAWSGCAFSAQGCIGRCTARPTSAPSAPTPQSAEDQSVGPTAFPTTQPSSRPTPRPTPRPTRAPNHALCAKPPGACASLLDLAACAGYSGCAVSSQACVDAPCQEFACGMANVAMQAAGNTAPGCLQGNAAACDVQRNRVFSALQLAPSCQATFVPSLQGGATLGTAAPASAGSAMDVFVAAAGGDDGGPGSRAQPFATIQAAVAFSRDQFAPAPRRVVLLPGVHRPAQAVQLVPLDAGLTLQGEPGAVVSGAVALAGLKWAAAGGGVLAADIAPDVAGRLDKLSQLYINGEPAIRARYPNAPEFLASAYASRADIDLWFSRPNLPPLSSHVSKDLGLGNRDYDSFAMGYGGPCTGVFTPEASYFCEPTANAAGGCPYSIPGGAQFSAQAAAAMKMSSWGQSGSGVMHAFHQSLWGLWSFELMLAATHSPTTAAPSPSPTHKPTSRAPSPRPASHAPSPRPSSQPATAGPSSSPSAGPSLSTQQPATSQPATSATLQPTATIQPSGQPTATTQPSLPTQQPLQPSAAGSRLRRALARHRGHRRSAKAVKAASAYVPRVWFGRGGFQEARGDCGNGGGNWFVENIFQLLDAPNEFYLERNLPGGKARLYFKPNVTRPDGAAGALVELSVLRDLVLVTSPSWLSPIANVSVRGIQFEKTYPTFMDPHEVASGGDWTVHRGAAVFTENSTGITVADCAFEHLGGNGVFVSNYAKKVLVTRNSFYVLGASAMLSAGSSRYEAADPWNYQTAQTFPADVEFSYNIASELGMLVKQSAGVFVSISKSVLTHRNVIFNGARAGMIQNDGFGGGNVFRRNVLFNLVRETSDHGPFNVWDRQKWLEPPGKLPFRVQENFLLGNINGPKGIDLDDGAQNYISSGNVIVSGYQKLKGNNIVATNNLILFPLVGACVYVTPANRFPTNWTFSNNTCALRSAGTLYSWTAMSPSDAAPLCALGNLKTQSNVFYGRDPASSSFTGCDQSSWTWSVWRAKGQDAGSSLAKAVPLDADLVALVAQALPWAVA